MKRKTKSLTLLKADQRYYEQLNHLNKVYFQPLSRNQSIEIRPDPKLREHISKHSQLQVIRSKQSQVASQVLSVQSYTNVTKPKQVETPYADRYYPYRESLGNLNFGNKQDVEIYHQNQRIQQYLAKVKSNYSMQILSKHQNSHDKQMQLLRRNRAANVHHDKAQQINSYLHKNYLTPQISPYRNDEQYYLVEYEYDQDQEHLNQDMFENDSEQHLEPEIV